LTPRSIDTNTVIAPAASVRGPPHYGASRPDASRSRARMIRMASK
jgi:hypothetical protein